MPVNSASPGGFVNPTDIVREMLTPEGRNALDAGEPLSADMVVPAYVRSYVSGLNPVRVIRLKPRVKDLWVRALNSGAFLQTGNALHEVSLSPEGDVDAESHCCLGVLCLLAAAEGVVDPQLEFESPGAQTPFYVDRVADPEDDGDSDETETGILPRAVVAWAFDDIDADGLGKLNPRRDPEVGRCLSSWNDDFDADFGAIAVLVEQAM